MDTAVGESKHRKWHRLMTADTAACSPLPVEQTLKKKRSYEAMSVMVTAENSEHGKYEDLIPFTQCGSAAAVQCSCLFVACARLALPLLFSFCPVTATTFVMSLVYGMATPWWQQQQQQQKSNT